MTRHELGSPADVFRRVLARPRRTAVALGLAAAVAGGATLASGGAPALAGSCDTYAVVFQTTSNGGTTGPGTTTVDPHELDFDTGNPPTNFIGLGGVTRPGTPATFHLKADDGSVLVDFTTANAGGSGVINQGTRNVLPWPFNGFRDRVQVFADIHTHCGTDQLLTNLFVGSILTFPAAPVGLNPKYLVLGCAYPPPGASSSVDYGTSTTLGSRLSFGASLQSGVTQSTTQTIGDTLSIGSSSSFSQKFQDSTTTTVEKTTSNDIIIPGPSNSQNGIDHNADLCFVWLNPTFRVAAGSFTSLLLSGFDVDPRDPVSPSMDVVQLTIGELKGLSPIDPGDASRLQRSWSPTGPLTPDDFTAIRGRDPFADGGTAIDPARFDLLPGVTFDYRPAAPGSQPITQKFTIRLQAATAASASFMFTSGTRFDMSVTTSSSQLIKNTLKDTNSQSLDITSSVSLDASTSANQTISLSLTGPPTGWQGPTALQAYQDNMFGTLLFAFAPVATFEIGAPGPNQTVTQGDGAAFPITTQSDFGFTGSVNFEPNVLGLPAGAQASFSPPSVGVGGGSTLNVTTSAQTPAGTYPLTITASSGLIVRHLTVNLVVNALPFTLSATPSSRTVSSGQSATFTITVNPASGFSGPVQLSGPAGLPPGTTASFNPITITGSGSSTLTVTTSASTPSGSSNLTVSATGGGTTRTATVGLVVDNTQDFGLAVTPQAAGVAAGDTALYTVTTTAINGFTGDVNLTVSGQPAGTTPALSVNPIAGAGSSTLGIGTSTSTAPGNYQLTITGTSGGLSHSQTVSLTVSPPPPDFSLTVAPATRSTAPSTSTTYTVSTAAIAGFAGSIGLSVSGLPAGATASFSPTTVSPGSGATLTVSAGSSTPPGTYQLAIVGASGSLSHGQVVTLVVQAPAADFTLSGTPGPLSATQGGSTTYSVSTVAAGGFTGSIGLSVTGLPAGVTASFNPSTVGTGSGSVLSVSVAPSVALGSYQFTITGTSGSLSHSEVVTLGVTAVTSDFTLTVSPTAGTVARGSSGATWVQTASVGGYSGSLDLSASGLPAGVTVTFDTTTIDVDSGVNMYPLVEASAAPGTYTITITATGAGLTHSQPFTLTVT
ncbi:MAG TPA: hypothetical protein VE953_07215 [Terriglobales bacterium]|nr:hypothetical protein [Terriglobales bacterium]